MRPCHPRHPSRSSATQDPCLHGVGHGLKDAYADLLRETLPEDWERLAATLADRLDNIEGVQEN